MSKYKITSPLRHKGSPPYLLEGDEHTEWHLDNSGIVGGDKSMEYESRHIIKTKDLVDQPIITQVATPESDIKTAKLLKKKKKKEDKEKLTNRLKTEKEFWETSGPTTVQQGNTFRRFVNDNYPEYATKIDLTNPETEDHNLTIESPEIKKAWATYGREYLTYLNKTKSKSTSTSKSEYKGGFLTPVDEDEIKDYRKEVFKGTYDLHGATQPKGDEWKDIVEYGVFSVDGKMNMMKTI